MRFQARRRIPQELGFVFSHQGGCCIYTYAVQSISHKLEFALLYAYAPLDSWCSCRRGASLLFYYHINVTESTSRNQKIFTRSLHGTSFIFSWMFPPDDKMAATSLAVLLVDVWHILGWGTLRRLIGTRTDIYWDPLETIHNHGNWQPSTIYLRQANGGQHMSRFVPSAACRLVQAVVGRGLQQTFRLVYYLSPGISSGRTRSVGDVSSGVYRSGSLHSATVGLGIIFRTWW